jgi:hypothetical protein
MNRATIHLEIGLTPWQLFHLLQHLEEFWGGTLGSAVLEMED